MEKKSYFNVGRRLTDEEWGELRDWTNSLASHGKKFVRHDRHSSKPGRSFRGYNKMAINGERWPYDDPTGGSTSRWKEKVYPSRVGESLYNVDRWLSKDEFKLLKSWVRDNPNKRWLFGDESVKFPGLYFIQYCDKSPNGEYWSNKIVLEKCRNYKQSANKKRKENRARVKDVKGKPTKCPVKEEMGKFKKQFRASFRAWVRNPYRPLPKKLVGILQTTSEDFVKYIESKWEPWMNWENYGGKIASKLKETWELDHIIPTFTADNMEDLYKLHHYMNTQPLCSFENRRMKMDQLDYIPISQRN